MPMIVTQNGDVQLLQNGVESAFTNVGLYQNPLVPTPTTILSEIESADFNGYDGQHDITWMPAFINALGKGQKLAPSTQWTSTAPLLNPNMIYGAFYLDSSADLSAIFSFDAPINVNAAAMAVFFQPSLTCVTEPPSP